MLSIKEVIKCKFGVSTISLITLAIFVANSCGVAQKIDAKIDLVVILMTFDNISVLNSTKRELAKLPELFEMGETKVKIAVVESNTNDVSQAVVFPLSGNKTGFKNWINDWKPVSSTKVYVQKAFEATRTRVFQNGGERARAVVVLLRGLTNRQDKAVEEAKKLRDVGVFIYAICQADGANCSGFPWGTDGSMRCIDVNTTEFNTEVVQSIKKLKDVILLDLCNWTTVCRFEKRNQMDCIVDVLPSTSFFNDQNRQCHNSILRPTTPRSNAQTKTASKNAIADGRGMDRLQIALTPAAASNSTAWATLPRAWRTVWPKFRVLTVRRLRSLRYWKRCGRGSVPKRNLRFQRWLTLPLAQRVRRRTRRPIRRRQPDSTKSAESKKSMTISKKKEKEKEKEKEKSEGSEYWLVLGAVGAILAIATAVGVPAAINCWKKKAAKKALEASEAAKDANVPPIEMLQDMEEGEKESAPTDQLQQQFAESEFMDPILQNYERRIVCERNANDAPNFISTTLTKRKSVKREVKK